MLTHTDLVPARPPAGQRRSVIVAGTTAVAAVLLAGGLMHDRVPPLDAWILANLYAPADGGLAGLATVVSGAGTLATLAMLLIAFGQLVVRGRRRAVGYAIRHLVLLVGCLTPMLLQAVFQRPGPPVVATDWTYPSGHAVVVTAAALTTVLVSRPLSRGWRVPTAATAVTAVLLVAASRVLLGEHYLIDVVAAVLVTVGVGLLLAAALRLWPASRGRSAA
ncbi:phosphatase PAP2 family protein [Plantactinospora sp. S1510]|uniref:Phosphatase PAP2 family protein n=1 Tax=Plantactinospora alkalitolerans TaxID=2789879 RepID=A0ABS0H2G5_9ACTN|nr:phosphatase PAP2 family protein [Plantactinospora alkalitolerans]MBF9132354.1 phosphatase PAP2 family protein [Plantactinospora alkalitolerans]